MPHPLDTLFSPASIALIGASRDLEKIPGRLLSMLRKNEFPGSIYPINPNYSDIDGLKCYSSIGDVGQPIDLAIVPGQLTAAAAAACCAADTDTLLITAAIVADQMDTGSGIERTVVGG